MPSQVKPNDVRSLPDPCEPSDVAVLFGVDPKTVSRWSTQGKIPFFRTLGGHRRYHKAEVIKVWQATHRQQIRR